MGQIHSIKFSNSDDDGEKPEKPKREMPPPMTRYKNQTFRKKTFDRMPKLPSFAPRQHCGLRLLKLNRVNDWLLMEEEFLIRNEKNKQRLDAHNVEKEAEEKALAALRGNPIGIGTVEEIPDDYHAIIVMEGCRRSWYLPILSVVDKDIFTLNSTVLVKISKPKGQMSEPHAIVGQLMDDVEMKTGILKMDKAPTETYEDVAGLDRQIMELKEAVELPLQSPELYEEMGIIPPKGVILYGPPGTGKTLLAKAVANKTSATFIRLVGSQLVQKISGEGPKLVRNIFKMARQEAPSIIFFDEIDSVGGKRYEGKSGASSGTKEVERTMLELLNQLDGFDVCSDVKVIMATNRIDNLDPALIRPGRIDRKIELTLPNQKERGRIFELHTSKMNIAPDVNFEELFGKEGELAGSDIKAVCTEAGMHALRDRRKMVCVDDFKKAVERIISGKKGKHESMFI